MKKFIPRDISVKNKDSAAVGFFGLLGILFILFFLGCIFSSIFTAKYFIVGSPLFFGDSGDVFMDFFNVNAFVENMNPYIEEGSSYPPFVLVLAKLFNYLALYESGGRAARASFAGVLSLILFLFLFFVPVYFLMRKVFRERGFSDAVMHLTYVAFLFTAPFLYAFTRGNYIFFALLFSIIFFVYYKDDRDWVRELAYVSLAVSVGIKLYPAVFALILIKERKWGEFFRVVLYCVCLVVLPFFAFEGGFVANVKAFIYNLNQFSSHPYLFYDYGGLFTNFYSYGVSIQNFVRIVYCKITGISMLDVGNAVNMVGVGCVFAVVALLVFSAMVTDCKWKHVCAMSLVQVVFPDPSYIYSMIFLFIPIVMFIVDKNKKGSDFVYLILFVLMLSPVQLGYILEPYSHGLQYGFSVSNFLEVIWMILMSICLFADAVREIRLGRDPVYAARRREHEEKFLAFDCRVKKRAERALTAVEFAVYRRVKKSIDKLKASGEAKERIIFSAACAVSLLFVVFLITGGIVMLGRFCGSVENLFRTYIYPFGISDFGQVIYFTMQGSPYVGEYTTSYTPIGILLFKGFGFICSFNDAFYTPITFEDISSYNEAIIRTPHLWACYCFYVIACWVALYFILRRMTKLSRTNYTLFFIALIFSNFFDYALIRGSNILLVFVFVAVFVRFKDDRRVFVRELAYLSLAVAGAMKIYPFFFGILLLRDKKWAESVHVGVYGLLLIFLPFLCLDGGFANVPLFFENMAHFTGREGRLLGQSNISLGSVVAKIFALFGSGKAVAIATSVVKVILGTALFVSGVYFGLKAKERFSLMIIIMCVITLLPDVSYVYLVIFATFALLEYATCFKQTSLPRKIYYTAFFLFMGFELQMAIHPGFLIGIFYAVTFLVEIIHVNKNLRIGEIHEVKKSYQDIMV